MAGALPLLLSTTSTVPPESVRSTAATTSKADEDRSNKGNKPLRGAIYARYSTKHQQSIADQIRMCREWADRNGVVIQDEHVFFDQARTGKTHRRTGLKAMTEALDELDVLICFSTNRLFRKSYMAMRFAEEEIVDRGKRCVFLVQNIDTGDTKRWRALLQIQAIVDEFQLQGAGEHTSAARMGMALEGRVYGTLAYGYVGTPTGKKSPQTGKELRDVTVDPVTAEWVKKVFFWHTNERISMGAIVRRLNSAGAPFPPCAPGRWTIGGVRYLLRNRRYIGDWSYGWHTSTWVSREGRATRGIREAPLRQHTIEKLRIIDNDTFAEAARILAANAERLGGGRPTSRSRGESSLHLLKGLLICEAHNRAFTMCGVNGQMGCAVCRDLDRPPIRTPLYRATAEKVLVQTVATLLRNCSEDSVAAIVASCQEATRTIQADPKDDRAALDRRLSSITAAIQFILHNPGATATDQRENAQQLALLRSQRAALESQIKKHPGTSPLEAPNSEQVRKLLETFGDILESAASGDDHAALVKARQLIVAVTGGRILVRQGGQCDSGPRRLGSNVRSGLAAKHWLRGTFTVDITSVVSNHFGFAGSPGGQSEVTVDFKVPNSRDKMADRAKALFDQGLLLERIAATMEVDRGTVRSLIHLWHKVRGLPVPNMKSRRNCLMPRKCHLIAETAAKLWNQGLTSSAIGKALNVYRITVLRAVHYWQKHNGVPLSERVTPPEWYIKKHGSF